MNVSQRAAAALKEASLIATKLGPVARGAGWGSWSRSELVARIAGLWAEVDALVLARPAPTDEASTRLARARQSGSLAPWTAHAAVTGVPWAGRGAVPSEVRDAAVRAQGALVTSEYEHPRRNKASLAAEQGARRSALSRHDLDGALQALVAVGAPGVCVTEAATLLQQARRRLALATVASVGRGDHLVRAINLDCTRPVLAAIRRVERLRAGVGFASDGPGMRADVAASKVAIVDVLARFEP